MLPQTGRVQQIAVKLGSDPPDLRAAVLLHYQHRYKRLVEFHAFLGFYSKFCKFFQIASLRRRPDPRPVGASRLYPGPSS
jgi:hypothetical protein